jgi:hypothetical protein
MHPLDISMAESGGPFRPMRPAPGLLGQVLCRMFFNPEERLELISIDQPLTDGEILPMAGGIEVIHTRWALRGTGCAAVASRTNAARGRCGHEPHGPR